MKRIWIILLLAAVVPLAATAQKKSASKTDFKAFYDQYSGRENFTAIEITGEMLKLFANDESAKAKSKTNTFDGIDKIRIVVSEKPDPVFVEEIKRLPDRDFTLMTTVTEGGQHVSFYHRPYPKHGHKSEFLMIVYGGKDNLALNITGEIDLKNISGLSGIRISGMDKLDSAGKK